MSATNDSGPPLGRSAPTKLPGRVAGFFVTLGIDVVIWVAFFLYAITAWRQSSAVAVMAIGANMGFIVAGVVLYSFARRHGYQKFNQGVIIATSVVFLLSVSCWSGTPWR
jgi:ABC-type methionine transport system permease subunit